MLSGRWGFWIHGLSVVMQGLLNFFVLAIEPCMLVRGFQMALQGSYRDLVKELN